MFCLCSVCFQFLLPMHPFKFYLPRVFFSQDEVEEKDIDELFEAELPTGFLLVL